MYTIVIQGMSLSSFPFLFASFAKAPAGRALEEVARLVVTEGLIFHKIVEFLWSFNGCNF